MQELQIIILYTFVQMINNSGSEITFISIGSKVINTVYYGANIVWQTVVGWWINNKPWINNNGWRNN